MLRELSVCSAPSSFSSFSSFFLFDDTCRVYISIGMIPTYNDIAESERVRD